MSNYFKFRHFLCVLVLSFACSAMPIPTSKKAFPSNSKTVGIPGSDQYIKLKWVESGQLRLNLNKRVQLDGFYMSETEVTYDQFVLFQIKSFDTKASDHSSNDYNLDAISRPTPPYEDFTKGMGKSGGFPAVSLTQQAALRYCHWLYHKTGVFFRLPTEAEWQYACMSGETEVDEIEEIAWIGSDAEAKFHKVAQKLPNSLGLYDMIGNVSEWTLDQYLEDYIEKADVMNPWIVPDRKHSRTVKGTSYESSIEDCNCSYRQKSQTRWQMRDPQIPKSVWWNTDSPFVGFRLVHPLNDWNNEQIDEFFGKAIVD